MSLSRASLVELIVKDNVPSGELDVPDSLNGDATGAADAAILTITAKAQGCPAGSQLLLELPRSLHLPESARSERLGEAGIEVAWSVEVDRSAAPTKARYAVRLRSPGGEPLAATSREIRLVLRGDTGFRPAHDGFPFANGPHLFGTPRPAWPVFERTFASRFVPARQKLFDGPYKAIFDSGLCTGMARAALMLKRSNAGDPGSQRSTLDPATRELIQIMHGKQLTDRALLSSALWLLRSSPRAVLRRFRQSILNANAKPVAIDVGVPKLLRRDFLRAVVRQGHTVVPYAYRLLPEGSAEIAVYDPQFPGNEPSSLPLRIEIDLAANSYRYRHWSSDEPGNPTTITAVPLDAYTNGNSTLIASWACLVGII